MQRKSGKAWSLVVALAALCWMANPALAGSIDGGTATTPNPLIIVNELGIGSMLFPGQDPVLLTSTMSDDPGPGGLHHALTFNLDGPPSLVEGDVKFGEGGDGYGDVIRFNAAGTGCEDYQASLVFYSEDIKKGSLGDTGLPHHYYNNVVTLPEINGIVMYTPSAHQPGYVSGYQVSYEFISDVPEPASWLLAISGGLLALGWRRRRV